MKDITEPYLYKLAIAGTTYWVADSTVNDIIKIMHDVLPYLPDEYKLYVQLLIKILVLILLIFELRTSYSAKKLAALIKQIVSIVKFVFTKIIKKNKKNVTSKEKKISKK